MDASQTAESLQVRSVAQRELLAALESGRQARTVVAVDACFSGRDGGGATLVPGLQPVLPAEVAPSARANTLIFSAARSDQFAGPLPGQDRPAFSYLLLGALRGWAASEEGGEVSAGAALSYARRHLRGLPDRQQTPELFGVGDIVLVRGVQEEDPVDAWRRAQIPPPVIEEPEAAPEADEETPAAVAEIEPVEPAMAPDRGVRVLPVALMAGGAAGILGGGGVWLSAQPLRSDLESGQLTERQGDDHIQRYNQRMVVAGGLAGLGAAALAAGVTVFVLDGRERGDLEVVATGSGLGLRVGF